ncbi:hypothetical protein CHS0354_039516 [Potamilus streckersoni]|uniref:Uncharacterized protein n=1 Tax=Potamilus streckersoni TaxID=2493646 RepID=A0AAE0TLW7_9BIVA|nr:hypothetical protein CHS0354_039516 [Potamilus streckersoni]
MAARSKQSASVDVTIKDSETFYVIYCCEIKTGSSDSDKNTDVSIPGTTDGKSACYHRVIETDRDSPDGDVPSADKKKDKFIVCFLANQDRLLDLFLVDLDRFALGVIKDLQQKKFHADDATKRSIQQWYTVSVEYVSRCISLLKNNVKFLIHAALLDAKLSCRGCTNEQENDIIRLFQSCNLSGILTQVKPVKQQHDNGSLSGSIDMLVDVGAGDNQSDMQNIVMVNITDNGVNFVPAGCTRFCEEWSKTLNKPEFQQNSVKLKQVIEAIKLKFIQTVNILKRLLREAENDFYALYRAYIFLRDSGNSNILLHYANLETSPNVASVVSVIDEFIKLDHIQRE